MSLVSKFMMSGDNFTDLPPKSRPALSDVSNQLGKRAFSSISSDFGLKSGNDNCKNVSSGQGDSQFSKKLFVGNDHSVIGKTDCDVESNKKHFAISKDKHVCGSSHDCTRVNTSVISNTASKIEASHSNDGDVQVVKGDTVGHGVVEAGDSSRDGCLSSESFPCSRPCEDGYDNERRLASDLLQNKIQNEGLVTHIYEEDEKDLDVGKLASSNSGCTEWSKLPKSLGSKSFELERCTLLKGDGHANVGAGAELLKGCPCSFCLKAAYIWSDLHYQDIKGRIAGEYVQQHKIVAVSALKKSQKEASSLVEKSGKGEGADSSAQGNSNRSSKLESDLVGRWRSLFHFMEDVFVHESSQLHDSFIMLKDLRENCKMDLERAMPSTEH